MQGPRHTDPRATALPQSLPGQPRPRFLLPKGKETCLPVKLNHLAHHALPVSARLQILHLNNQQTQLPSLFAFVIMFHCALLNF